MLEKDSLVDATDQFDQHNWDEIKKLIPGLEYNKTKTDYRNANNLAGYQQRAFSVIQSVKAYEKMGCVGIDIGCGQQISPFCLGVDSYAGNSHPEYGGGYYPHVQALGEFLPFKDNSVGFIVSHHSLEHMKDTMGILKEWLRIVKFGGRIIIVMPDAQYGKSFDKDHKMEFTSEDFRKLLNKIDIIRIIEYDTLQNHFSFNVVIEKTTRTNICIIGSGNVGKRLGQYFEPTTNVTFYDVNNNVIDELNNSGHIATSDIAIALKSTDISFIVVHTPLRNDGLFDVSYLENVCKDIGTIIKDIDKYHVFVIKSTVIPGTVENVIIPTIEKYSHKREGKDFGIVYNPEFLTSIDNTWTSDRQLCVSPSNEYRIIIGEGSNKSAGDIIQELYGKTNYGIPVLRTDYRTAEMAKLVANNRLALAISFSNDIFLICNKLKEHNVKIDVDFIIDSISLDHRIGKYGSVFGKAWGGPCFLKDTIALDTYIKNETGTSSRLVSDSININIEIKDKYGIRQ